MVSYIRDVLDVFGINLLDNKEADVQSSGGRLEHVVEQLTRFRSEVRAFALARQPAGSGVKPGLYPDRVPLLKACDSLRSDLAPLGVLIKDRGATSTWEIAKQGQTPRDQDQDQETPS